jgi:GT2 family glycosyltransferase
VRWSEHVGFDPDIPLDIARPFPILTAMAVHTESVAQTAPMISGSMLGVAITTFGSAGIIAECLDSLLACRADVARVVITDNASTDDTCAVIRAWAAQNGVAFAEAVPGEADPAHSWLTLLRSPVNRGFAYATNRGLELLLRDPAIGLFWLVNPDCLVTPEAAAQYRHAGRDQDFSLMGGRTVFQEHRDTVQTDGGRVSLWTGVCQSVNWGQPVADAPFPDAASLDFITGANCVASRRFLEEIGLMEEGYFLYYEEVDWALRRGSLPLRVVPEAIVYHYGGTAIGSAALNRCPSPFANYFNHRNRIRFIRRHRPVALPVAFAYGLAKSLQLLIRGTAAEARAVLTGLLGIEPPQEVLRVLPPETRAFALKAAYS